MPACGSDAVAKHAARHLTALRVPLADPPVPFLLVDRVNPGTLGSPRRDSNAWKILDLLTTRPVLDSATAARELGIRQQNVYPPMKGLVDAEIVKSKPEHQLGPFWRSDEVLGAIDRFAERAGRREAT